MKKVDYKGNRKTETYLFIENPIQKGLFGWKNIRTGEYVLPPIFPYNVARYYDLLLHTKTQRRIEQAVISKVLNSAKVKKKISLAYNNEISIIQEVFIVSLIKNACEEYIDSLCKYSSNQKCVRCDFKHFDASKLEEERLENE